MAVNDLACTRWFSPFFSSLHGIVLCTKRLSSSEASARKRHYAPFGIRLHFEPSMSSNSLDFLGSTLCLSLTLLLLCNSYPSDNHNMPPLIVLSILHCRLRLWATLIKMFAASQQRRPELMQIFNLDPMEAQDVFRSSILSFSCSSGATAGLCSWCTVEAIQVINPTSFPFIVYPP
jgi:hypothetical protein